jgi:hypothetical protein
MLFVLVGAAAGAYLATRPYAVFAPAPVVVLFGAGAMITGIVAGHDPRIMVVEVLGAIASPQ